MAWLLEISPPSKCCLSYFCHFLHFSGQEEKEKKKGTDIYIHLRGAGANSQMTAFVYIQLRLLLDM